MTALLWVLVVAGVLLLAGAAVSCAGRVRRLDRLHVRVDAARAGLASALARRADAADRVAAVLTGRDPSPTGAGAALRAAATAARSAGSTRDGDREGAENHLGRALARVDRSVLPAALLEELVDAEQLLILARRVHNDAVRDTLGLRSRRLVRWLHLAGTAPMPVYFEIADPEPGVIAAAQVPGARTRVGPSR